MVNENVADAKKIFKLFPAGNYPDLGSGDNRYGDGNWIKEKVLSLKIDGNYLALLFEDINFQNKCEVVSADQFNLGIDHPVGKGAWSLKVIPAQK